MFVHFDTNSTASMPLHRRPLRVLLVDDHALVRQALSVMLSRQPDVVVAAEAQDGVEAIEKVEHDEIDVVLMDVTMPRMGGLEATRILSNRYPNVRIIGLSMHDGPEMAGAMIRAGASDFLNKDCGLNTLIAAITGRDEMDA